MHCKTCFISIQPMDSYNKTFNGEALCSYFCSMKCLHHYRINKECMNDVNVKNLIEKFQKKMF